MRQNRKSAEIPIGAPVIDGVQIWIYKKDDLVKLQQE